MELRISECWTPREGVEVEQEKWQSLQINELPRGSSDIFVGIIYSEILIKLTRLVINRLFTKGHLL